MFIPHPCPWAAVHFLFSHQFDHHPIEAVDIAHRTVLARSVAKKKKNCKHDSVVGGNCFKRCEKQNLEVDQIHVVILPYFHAIHTILFGPEHVII